MHIRLAYALPFFTAAAFILAVGMYTLSRRKARGAGYLTLLCLAASFWAATEGMLYFGFDVETDLFITGMQYVGIALCPPLALLFGFAVFGYERQISSKIPAILFGIAGLIVLVVWTNGFHQLFFLQHYKIETGPFPMLGLEHGILWWLTIGYHYTLMAILSLLLIRQVVMSSGFHRSQAGIMLSAVVIVWVVNAIYVSGNSPVPNMDIGPLAFSLVAVAMAWGFFRYSLLDILPVAKSEIFDGIGDPIMVVDEKDRLIDINPAAASKLAIDAVTAIGKRLDDLFDGTPLFHLDAKRIEPGVICLEMEREKHFIDLRISDLEDKKGKHIGRLIVLHDITARIMGEEAQKEHARLQGVVEMAGAVCHELNQPLMAITGYADLLVMKTPCDDPLYEKIEKIQDQVNKLSDITRKLMNITRYETKDYLHSRIIDIDKSSNPADPP